MICRLEQLEWDDRALMKVVFPTFNQADGNSKEKDQV